MVFCSIQNGVTALHVAADKGYLNVIEKLFEGNADVNINTNVSMLGSLECH